MNKIWEGALPITDEKSFKKLPFFNYTEYFIL
jgi:hypothetical protein